MFSLSKKKAVSEVKEFGWKFNSSLTEDQGYIIEIKKMIRSFSTTNKCLSNRQLKWELLKYEVRIYEVPFARDLSLENFEDSYLFFDWLYFTQCVTSFSSIDHLLRRYAWFLILFHLT